MALDQLKTEWQQYNQKLSVSLQLNEQLIISMLKERSRSRISRIRGNNIAHMISMVVMLVVLAGVFIGNPFDFKHTMQYVPYGVIAVGILLTIASLVKSLQQFNVDINNVDLATFLKSTIGEYEKNLKMHRWFVIILFSAGISTVFSFLPKKLETQELWPALGETGIMLGIILAIYFLAYKLGAFKNRKKEGFENDWKELNQLKAISTEFGDTEKS